MKSLLWTLAGTLVFLSPLSVERHPVAQAASRDQVASRQLWSSALQGRGRAVSDNQIVLDAETLRYYLESVRGRLGDVELSEEALDRLSAALKQATLTRRTDSMKLTLELTDLVRLDLRDKRRTKTGGIYAVEIPKRLEFVIRILDGLIRVDTPFWPSRRLRFKANIPALPDTVWLKQVLVDLESARAQVVATILGSTVAVVAEAEMVDGKPDVGLDIWDTVLLNLIALPPMSFSPLK